MQTLKAKNNIEIDDFIYPLFFYSDVWDLNNSFFKKHKEYCSSPERLKKIDFSKFINIDIKNELKRFVFYNTPRKKTNLIF